jgi:hypothetical protein
MTSNAHVNRLCPAEAQDDVWALYEEKERDVATAEWKQKSDSTPGSPDQAGALGAYSSSAMTMQPPGKEVPASHQERILAAKISRAMLSGPREITKDATVASCARAPTTGFVFPEMRMRSAMFRCAPIQWVCNG